MASPRELLNKSPWMGWALAGVLLLLAGYLYLSRGKNTVAYSPDSMKEMVTIKFADTGDEILMPRGRFERQLREGAQGTLDASRGLINPKTQQPTGFLFNKSDWDETIARINKERKEAGTVGQSVQSVRRDDAPVAKPADGAGTPK